MRKLLLFALATMLFAACAEDALNEPSGITTPETRTLSVTLDDSDTRIQLNEEKKTVWTEGDLLSVFYRSTTNEQWQFTGATGDRTGDIVPVDSSLVPPATTNDIVVVYPYNTGYFYNSDTKNVQASLPAEQTYLKDSYGLDGNILVSRSEYNQVSLKSVCGWLKLQLTGAGEKVRSITLRGNNGEQVAGELYINTSDATATLASADPDSDSDEGTGEAGGTLVRPGTILTEVTLNCGEGVTLGSEAMAFYIALPPQTFSAGVTVEIECNGYKPMTLMTEKEIVIERNHIQPMAVVEHDAEKIIPNNEIWYTATEKVKPYNQTVFGATYVSNVWDSETGNGIIAFDGDVSTIGDEAFRDCDSLTSVTIPDSVTTIGNSAFADCYNLTGVTIPDSVTTIGRSVFFHCSSLTEFRGKFAEDNGMSLVVDGTLIAFATACGATEYTILDSVTAIGNYAFYGCSSLTSVTIPESVTLIGDTAFGMCKSLENITIPKSVTTIHNWAFSDCNNLTSATIGEGVTAIGEGVFAYCYNLAEFKGKYAADNGRCLMKDDTIFAYANASGTEYTIPDGVSVIEKSAFRGCTDLVTVTIPSGITTINVNAFLHCDSLMEVYCKPTTPPSAIYYSNYWNAFPFNDSAQKIYVPVGSGNTYKSAPGWSEYKSYIEEKEF